MWFHPVLDCTFASEVKEVEGWCVHEATEG